MADDPAQRLARDFPAGHVLFREADVGREMYVVKSGSVQLTRHVGGSDVAMHSVGPGEFFGEMSILNNRPRTATATISQPATLLVIDPPTFEGMVRGNGEIAVRIIKKLAARLADADERIAALLPCSARARVAQLLAKHAAGDAARPPLQLSDLVRRAGLEAEVVAVTVRRLVAGNLVASDGNSVRVTDLARLQRLLDYLRLEESFGEI